MKRLVYYYAIKYDLTLSSFALYDKVEILKCHKKILNNLYCTHDR